MKILPRLMVPQKPFRESNYHSIFITLVHILEQGSFKIPASNVQELSEDRGSNGSGRLL